MTEQRFPPGSCGAAVPVMRGTELRAWRVCGSTGVAHWRYSCPNGHVVARWACLTHQPSEQNRTGCRECFEAGIEAPMVFAELMVLAWRT